MSKKGILAISLVALIIVLVLLIQNNNVTNNSNVTHVSTSLGGKSGILYLFPTKSTNFSLLGSYLSQSRYAMAEIYGYNATLFASPFLWNIQTANGVTNMTFSSSYLRVVVNMSGITKITPSIQVDGYPGLMYGEECWFPFSGKTITSQLLPLPMIISDLPPFYSFVNFTVFSDEGTIQDFSYDIWLTKYPNTTYLQYGDFEVMIWMYGSNYIENNSYFIYVGNMTFPTYINGTYTNTTWLVYILPRTGSANGWTGVYILSTKKLEGKIGVPLSFILKNLSPYLEKAGIDFYNTSTYYLDAIQIGMEFNDNNGNALLGYTLYSWYFNFT